jgi:hypothetical protein
VGAPGGKRRSAARRVGNQRADAHDGVVDVLREPVAESLTNVRIPLADEIVGGCEPWQVGHSLQVPDDDAWFHVHAALSHQSGGLPIISCKMLVMLKEHWAHCKLVSE